MNEKSEQLAKILQHYNVVNNTVMSSKFKIVCPFHGDLNASMLIDLFKGEYYCFGCGCRGDALDFVKRMERDKNALEQLLIFNRILSGCEKSEFKYKIQPRMTNAKAIQEAKRYYYSLPITDWHKDSEARQYMLKRGFNIKTLTDVGARENFNGDYGVVFPIRENGRFRGYVCRATNPEMEKKRKYLYNTGFSRYNSFFGDARFQTVIIVEGSMDYFKLRQHGLENVVAILGWRITEKQIEKIQQYTNNVISALDNTPTGRQGTKFLKNYFNVVRFQFPENVKDPGDLDDFDFNLAWAKTKEKALEKGFVLGGENNDRG